MKTCNPITIKTKLLMLAALCLQFYTSQAQTYLTNNNLSGTQAAGEYYHSSSITLSPGFSFTASSGNSLHLYITGQECIPLATAPSSSQNYIMTSTPRIAGYDPAITAYTSCDVMQTIQYIDGLGRPLQTVQVKGSPNADKDVVQPFEYDAFGREAKKDLPYTQSTTTPGAYRSSALSSEQAAFYGQTGQNYKDIPTPYAITVFEPSPLNRPVEQGAPGNSWQPGQHTSGIAYMINDNNLISFSTGTGYPARLYQVTIDANGIRSLVDGGSDYPAGQLTVTVSHDENYSGTGKAGTVEEYKDKEGHVVLKRTFNLNKYPDPNNPAQETLSTYYVYDDLGNLAFVLPPGATPDAGLSSAGNPSTLNNFCYQYNYDERNRLIQKRVPGKDWEYLVYNQLDQPVLTQDGNQRGSNQWTATKYDALGRVIMTGLWNANSPISQAILQASIYAAAQWDARDYGNATTGYSISSYPTSLNAILTVSYYDDYNNIPGMPGIYDQHSSYSTMTKGLATASSTAILLPDGTVSSDRLLAVHYYDDEGRVVKTFSQHYLKGVVSVNNYDEISSLYNFDNSVHTTSRSHHTNDASGAATLTIADAYTYDHVGRELQTDESINSAPAITLSKTEYNEIGQLYKKHLHSTNGSSYLQDITYAYNERGWLSQINDPVAGPTATTLFNMKLGYNNPVSPNSTAQFNGNISEQVYNKGTVGQKFVTYNYDNLNRLVAGNSNEGFSENDINYDLMGNLKTLHRFGDHTGVLTYAYYSGTNQLSGVTSDNSSVTRTYGPYDANGNAPSDGQEHNISYNLLNLPRSIPSLNLSYTYDATGRKLRKVNTTGVGTITDYIDGIQYNGTNIANGTNIDFAMTEEGRVLHPTASPDYEYTLTDHLGNNRVTFDQTNGKVGEDDYYPFGLDAPRQVNAGNKYLYNKKELQDELNQYDYGARFYDPVIARWSTPDPLAEFSRRFSLYSYVENNPIRNIDIDGMFTDTTVNGHSAITTHDQKEIATQLAKYKAKPVDPKLKKEKENKKEPKGETFWHGFVRGIPGIGPGREYMEQMNAGNYWAATAALGMFTFDLFTLGSSTVEKTVVEEGTNVVYHSVSNGVTQYVGITNNLARREAEHLASRGINIEPLMQNLSRTDARAVEQVLIEIHGLGAKGGTLLNKINSISASNPAYGAQVKRGYQLLKSIGYH